ncbi:MAG TPA: VOC family protein, partial [Lacipirellulaceae bacterium]|nr:VOC family protein [Lacipirellulaceae bacterium]
MIHLIHDEGHIPPALDEPIQTRGHHFALSVADYDDALAKLRDMKVPFIERVLPGYGYRQVFFRDPDGNVL